jgi:hypothetical protein
MFSVSINQSFDLGRYGKITGDVSKSSGQYNRSTNSLDAQVLQQKSAVNYVLNNFWETVAFSVKHEFDSRELNIAGNIYFRYAGGGYQSPLSSSVANGRRQVGGSAKKAFFENRLQIQARADYRVMPYLNNMSNSLRSTDLFFQTRYKVKKRLSTGLQYSSTLMNQVNSGIKSGIYSIKRFISETNYSYKVGYKHANLYVNIGGQIVSNPEFTLGSGSSIVTTVNHTLILNNSSVNINLFINKEVSGNSILGNLLTGESSYQYSLSKKIQSSSSAVFLNNGTVAKQIGLRQGFQTELSRGFAISGFFDIRHELIDNKLPGLYSKYRGEVSLSYSFIK